MAHADPQRATAAAIGFPAGWNHSSWPKISSAPPPSRPRLRSRRQGRWVGQSL